MKNELSIGKLVNSDIVAVRFSLIQYNLFIKKPYITFYKNGTIEFSDEKKSDNDVMSSVKLIKNGKFYAIMLRREFKKHNYILIDLKNRKFELFDSKKDIAKRIFELIKNRLNENLFNINVDIPDEIIEKEIEKPKVFRLETIFNLYYYILEKYFGIKLNKSRFARVLDLARIKGEMIEKYGY